MVEHTRMARIVAA
jgi:hypothetical protein